VKLLRVDFDGPTSRVVIRVELQKQPTDTFEVGLYDRLTGSYKYYPMPKELMIPLVLQVNNPAPAPLSSFNLPEVPTAPIISSSPPPIATTFNFPIVPTTPPDSGAGTGSGAESPPGPPQAQLRPISPQLQGMAEGDQARLDAQQRQQQEDDAFAGFEVGDTSGLSPEEVPTAAERKRVRNELYSNAELGDINDRLGKATKIVSDIYKISKSNNTSPEEKQRRMQPLIDEFNNNNEDDVKNEIENHFRRYYSQRTFNLYTPILLSLKDQQHRRAAAAAEAERQRAAAEAAPVEAPAAEAAEAAEAAPVEAAPVEAQAAEAAPAPPSESKKKPEIIANFNVKDSKSFDSADDVRQSIVNYILSSFENINDATKNAIRSSKSIRKISRELESNRGTLHYPEKLEGKTFAIKDDTLIGSTTGNKVYKVIARVTPNTAKNPINNTQITQLQGGAKNDEYSFEFLIEVPKTGGKVKTRKNGRRRTYKNGKK
jgi:hypothetical protein